MNSIRSRLLMFLGPMMIAFIALISIFLYINWNREIINNTSILATNCEELSATIEGKSNRALIIIILSAGATSVFVIIGIYIIADRISRPFKHLKNSALAIAAGQYGEKISVEGPSELVELANTLNTMSECLEENLKRLKESSLMRERLYGEYECALLLQREMLDQVIKNYSHPQIELKNIHLQSGQLYGLLFDIKTLSNGEIEIVLAEAQRKGFSAIFQLLTEKVRFKSFKEPMPFPFVYLRVDNTQNHLDGIIKGMPRPLLWSSVEQQLIRIKDHSSLHSGDFLLLYNQGLSELLESEETLYNWISRLFKHFAADGISVCSAMLEKELQFIVRKKNVERDVHLICIQIKSL